MIVYLFNLLFSCLYLSFVKANRLLDFIIKTFPIILLWVIIIGGQYYVGRDYAGYLSYFHVASDNRFEPLFKLISQFLVEHGIYDQGPFFVFAFINAIVIFIAAYRLNVKYWGLFYFLLITVSTFFNNQMNGIRQCLAVSFVFWAFVEAYNYNSKIRGLILILIAMGFHYSAAICIIFLFPKVTHYSTLFPRLLLCISLVSVFIKLDNMDVINKLLDIATTSDVVSENTSYEMYYNSDSSDMSLLYKISKALYIPVYWYSLKLLPLKELTSKEELFYKLGFLSFNLRLILLVNHLVGRFSYYFWIPAIFPIYYLVRHYYNKKNTFAVIFILLYVSIIYFIKIFMGENEYKYDFFLLHN